MWQKPDLILTRNYETEDLLVTPLHISDHFFIRFSIGLPEQPHVPPQPVHHTIYHHPASKRVETDKPCRLHSMSSMYQLVKFKFFPFQVSLKSPDAVVVLPIYIGNITLNTSPSRTVASTPDHSGAAGITPTAPPAEEHLDESLCTGGAVSEEIPTKSHSQQDSSGQPVTMSPSAFSHAPGAAMPPGHRRPDMSSPLFCLSTGATIPFFTEGDVTPIPTSCSLILPPEYSSWDYPHGQ